MAHSPTHIDTDLWQRPDDDDDHDRIATALRGVLFITYYAKHRVAISYRRIGVRRLCIDLCAKLCVVNKRKIIERWAD